jgi:hypothetical protein
MLAAAAEALSVEGQPVTVERAAAVQEVRAEQPLAAPRIRVAAEAAALGAPAQEGLAS